MLWFLDGIFDLALSYKPKKEARVINVSFGKERGQTIFP